MAKLGRVITQAIVQHYGRQEMLRRLAHPFWFQCFGAVMGMDWHSSGITTSVLYALKRGLLPIQKELGIYICGGRGKYARQTPQELIQLSNQLGLEETRLTQTSRLVAKIDSSAVQDGYQLYLHNFILTQEGDWAIIQQGMNPTHKKARRYHWLSENLTSFIDAPHKAIEGPNEGSIVNLTDPRANLNRELQTQMIQEDNPDKFLEKFKKILPELTLPAHHEVRKENIQLGRLYATFEAAKNRGAKDFPDLLLTPGLGERTLWALAMVAEVIHGAPAQFQDPARFSLAHGGKDGHPYPVPLKVYDETIRVLKTALNQARIGNEDKLVAIRRLDEEAKKIDRSVVRDFDLEGFLAQEKLDSPKYHGKTVFD